MPFDGSRSAGTTSPEADQGRVRRFVEDGRLASCELEPAKQQKGLHPRPYLLVSRVQCACDCSVIRLRAVVKHRGASRRRRVRQLARQTLLAAAARGARAWTCLRSQHVAHGRQRARTASLLDRTPQCSPGAPVAEAPFRKCSDRHAEPRRGSPRRAPRTQCRIAHPLASAQVF